MPSFDYSISGYSAAHLVKMQILVNGDPVDALSIVVHRDKAEYRGPGNVRTPEGADSTPPFQDPGSGRYRRDG